MPLKKGLQRVCTLWSPFLDSFFRVARIAFENILYHSLVLYPMLTSLLMHRFQGSEFHWERLNLFEAGNSDLLRSVTNLALNTLLIYSKIDPQTPSIIPRVVHACFGFSGLISMNRQIADWVKHFRDCRLALKCENWESFALTAARVVVKAMNVFLTFSASVTTLIALAGYGGFHLRAIHMISKIALLALVGTVSGDFIDYAGNDLLLRRLKHIQSNESEKIGKISERFLILMDQKPFEKLDARIAAGRVVCVEEALAVDALKQIDEWRLGLLQESLKKVQSQECADGSGQEIFNKIVRTLEEAQRDTYENISLSAVGYVCLALCRAFPYTLLQYSLNWGTCFLYTYQMAMRKGSGNP